MRLGAGVFPSFCRGGECLPGTVEHLMDFLAALGQDAEVSVRPARGRQGQVSVVA
ncbi:MAG: hypothetical protein ACRD3N_02250 [Terracidiphilus sp.]